MLSESRLTFRALPFDCDINLHVNNSRYLSFMDLGRVHLMGHGKLLTTLYKNRWIPVITAVEMSFIKAIKPFQEFELISRAMGWDENYVYIEQCFEVAGTLVAIAMVKATFVIDGKKCQMQNVMELVEPDAKSPPLPEVIEQWKVLMDTKKAAAV